MLYLYYITISLVRSTIKLFQIIASPNNVFMHQVSITSITTKHIVWSNLLFVLLKSSKNIKEIRSVKHCV